MSSLQTNTPNKIFVVAQLELKNRVDLFSFRRSKIRDLFERFSSAAISLFKYNSKCFFDTYEKVKRVVSDFFTLCPDAYTTTKVATENIEKAIRSLGLQTTRPDAIKILSEEYLKDEWTHVTQLTGVGKFAADSYAIFCMGHWERVRPTHGGQRDSDIGADGLEDGDEVESGLIVSLRYFGLPSYHWLCSNCTEPKCSARTLMFLV